MKNIMKLFLYAALPLALIALGSCSYPKNITFKADSQTGALSGLYLTSDTSMNWILRTDGTIRMGGLPVWMGIGTSSDKRH